MHPTGLEPIWSIYVPGNPAFWAKHDYVDNPLFSPQFWNPLYFIVAVALTVYGGLRRWLTSWDLIVASGMLLIPYVMQGHRMMMLGQGRFTCVMIPMFIVLGNILSRLPLPAAVVIVSTAACALLLNSAMFAAWHRMI